MNLAISDGDPAATRPKPLLMDCRYAVVFHIDTTLCEIVRVCKRICLEENMRPSQNETSARKMPFLVSKREAAALLGVCVRSIDNYVAAKELPCRRLGRRVLIPYAALVRFVRQDHVAKREGEL